MTTSVGTLVGFLKFETGEAQNSVKDTVKGFKNLEASLGAVAKVATTTSAVITAGITAATIALGKQLEAEKKLEVAVKATGAAVDVGAIKEYAAALQGVTTFGDEATIAAAGMLVQFGLNEQQLKQTIPLVQDMSAAMGTDLATASRVVGMAIAGNAGSMSRYGVVLSENEKEAFKVANESQRLAIVLGKLQGTVGGAAQALAGTGLGAMTQFKNAVGDLLESFGTLFESDQVSFFQTMTNFVGEATAFINGLDESTKMWLGRIASGAAIVTGFVGTLSGIALVLPGLIAGFAVMAPLILPVVLTLGKIAIAAGLVVGAFKLFQSASKETQTAIVNGFAAVLQTVTQILDATFGNIIRAHAELFSTLGSMVAKLPGEVGKAGAALVDFVSPFKEFEFEFANVMEFWVGSADAAGLEITDGLVKKMAAMFAKLKGMAKGLGESLTPGAPSAPVIPGVSLPTGVSSAASVASVAGGASAGAGGGASAAGAFANASAFGAAIGTAVAPGIGGAVGSEVGGALDKVVANFQNFLKSAASSLNQTLGETLAASFSAVGAFAPLLAALSFATASSAAFGGILITLTAAAIALGGAILFLSTKTASFARVQEVFSRGMNAMIVAVEPLAFALLPVANLFVAIAEGIGPALFNVLTVITFALLSFQVAILDVVTRLQILAGFDEAAGETAAMAVEARAARSEMQALSFETALAASLQKDLNDQLQSSSFNLPPGYKLAGSRLDSEIGNVPIGNVNTSTMISIDTVMVNHIDDLIGDVLDGETINSMSTSGSAKSRNQWSSRG